MFKKVLIANRGEIACRVARTCGRMGISTVAVYSSADRHALHKEMAEEAYWIGAAPSSESYLNKESVLAVARACGADAVHPGFGFLSENAEFAAACNEQGVKFIGPPTHVIKRLGSKLEAKEFVSNAGISVLPGSVKHNESNTSLAAIAVEIGFPVIVKPSAGGGGRGMRIVRKTRELKDVLNGARREALSSFGDDSLLIEKFIANARHIEVQIFADNHGNAVHLFERDCSIQRRYQKVIEEAPAPGLTEDLRHTLFEAALKIAKIIGYTGAGTVEFLVEPNNTFWFIEINPRLQVEHPITEQITGLDLVEWQLRVAAGQKLPLSQSEIPCNGHSIEARLYAEDPAKELVPSPGRIDYLKLPVSSPNIRVEAGIRTGDFVTTYYDPMVAKIIATAKSRKDAITILSEALGQVRVAGPQTNERFLKKIIDHPKYRSGTHNTDFIPRHLKKLQQSVDPIPNNLHALVAIAEFSRPPKTQSVSPWEAIDGWRLNSRQYRQIIFHSGDKKLSFEYVSGGLVHEEKFIQGSGAWRSEHTFLGSIQGKDVSVTIIKNRDVITAFVGNKRYILEVYNPLKYDTDVGAGVGSTFASMPGVVVAVHVERGAHVEAGKPLLVIEAMKVEHTIRAPFDGFVSEVCFEIGDLVNEGDQVIRLDSDTEV
ncbi:MAG: biotin carboxylase N-terminal domain-containing protein [Pseudomonadota bacterium]|nr:biotin carboxylase N-terminal domain-containing protein [Pseudomonadota bacterium]